MVSESRIIRASTVRALTIPGDAIVRDPQGATQVFLTSPTAAASMDAASRPVLRSETNWRFEKA